MILVRLSGEINLGLLEYPTKPIALAPFSRQKIESSIFVMPHIFINECFKIVNQTSQSNYQAKKYYQLLISTASDISTLNG
ncbi:MAG TPA: hypothetical protein P5239_06760, partial [Victivallales bacterium]|nr:hypothetical protein [Victivallales bacterium]